MCDFLYICAIFYIYYCYLHDLIWLVTPKSPNGPQNTLQCFLDRAVQWFMSFIFKDNQERKSACVTD